MNQERQTLTPAEIIDFAHELKLEVGSSDRARKFIDKAGFNLLDGKTIREAVDEGKISDAYHAFKAYSDGVYI
jgi:hypothetical protein